jgi:hypothetical protein
MDEDVWKLCPSTINAVERWNKDCKRMFKIGNAKSAGDVIRGCGK